MKAEDLCECKHRAELIALRQRVEDQRKELARLNGLAEELRSTLLHQIAASKEIMYRTINDLALRVKLMDYAEKDAASSAKPAEDIGPGKAG